MSRSGYSDCLDEWDLIRWRGAVKSAIRGRRGQAFLREMLAALDGLEPKRLIAGDLVKSSGEVCAIGSVAVRRGIDLTGIDPEDRKAVAHILGIAEALAAEIAYLNDECFIQNPEDRYRRVRAWVVEQLEEPNAS